MNFEELQQSWRSQQIDIPTGDSDIKTRVADQWRKQQRRLMWTNIGTTLAFFAVIINFGWVYVSFHTGRTIFFSGSLLFMTILLLVYLWILWRGVAYKKSDPTLSSIVYLDHYLQKLYWRRKTITSFSWIYAVLLWLALMFYCIDVTKGGSLLLQIGAPISITLYIFGMQLIVLKTKRKNQLKKLDALIADIQQLKDAIKNEA